MRLTVRDLKHEVIQGLVYGGIPPHCFRVTQKGGGVRIQVVLRDRLIDEDLWCSGGIASARFAIDRLVRAWEISRETRTTAALDEQPSAG